MVERTTRGEEDRKREDEKVKGEPVNDTGTPGREASGDDDAAEPAAPAAGQSGK